MHALYEKNDSGGLKIQFIMNKTASFTLLANILYHRKGSTS